VRNLAQRSANAAKDTTDLIDDCVTKAGEGATLTGKCKDALQEIVVNVKKATDLTTEINNASTEQSDGIDQVNNAVQQMDQVTQQNAANAEEAASASEEMMAQAQSLKEQVDVLSKLVGYNVEEELQSSRNSSSQTYHEQYQPSAVRSNGNGNGKSFKSTPSNAELEAAIPMGENRIIEQNDSMSDF